MSHGHGLLAKLAEHNTAMEETIRSLHESCDDMRARVVKAERIVEDIRKRLGIEPHVDLLAALHHRVEPHHLVEDGAPICGANTNATFTTADLANEHMTCPRCARVLGERAASAEARVAELKSGEGLRIALDDCERLRLAVRTLEARVKELEADLLHERNRFNCLAIEQKNAPVAGVADRIVTSPEFRRAFVVLANEGSQFSGAALELVGLIDREVKR